MASQNTNRASTSSFGRESPPEDLDKDWASLFGSEGESDAAQPGWPPKKVSEQKPKNISTAAKLDAVDIGESDESDEEEEYEVEAIKAHRTKHGRIEYRIRWKTYGPKDDTWEPASHLVGAEEILKKYKSEHDIRPKHTSQSSSKRTRNGDEDKEQESDLNSKQSSTLERKRNKHLTKHSIPHLRNNGGTSKKNNLSDVSLCQRPQSPSVEDDESIPQQEWHARYRQFASWDHLIKSVRTVQRDVANHDHGSKTTSGDNYSDALYVCLLWQSGKTTWVPNSVARIKLPQKMLDFYQNETTMKLSSK